MITYRHCAKYWDPKTNKSQSSRHSSIYSVCHGHSLSGATQDLNSFLLEIASKIAFKGQHFSLRSSHQKDWPSRCSALSSQPDCVTVFSSGMVCNNSGKGVGVESLGCDLPVHASHITPSALVFIHPWAWSSGLIAKMLITWYSPSQFMFPFKLVKIHFCCLQPSNPNKHILIHSLAVLQYLAADID